MARTTGVKMGRKSKSLKAYVKKKRRVLTTEYKLALLKKIDAMKGYGEIGDLLDREGIYYSTVSNWRRLLRMNKLGTTPQGRKKKSRESLAKENLSLKRLVQALEKRVAEHGVLLDLQQKFFRGQGQASRVPLTANRIALIEKAGTVCGVGKVCDALGISRATFYRYRK